VGASREVLEDLDNMLMLFYTGKTRQASRILSQQKANIGRRVDTLRGMVRQAREARQLIESATSRRRRAAPSRLDGEADPGATSAATSSTPSMSAR
jgi:galactokinase/mevalonate kinase-like predicted kinase